MPKATENSHIPLVCTLCPKQPRFSDVSHLLTHISSKSHLSNRFGLQIASQQSPNILHQLQVYEAWYDSYGIARLLGERMSMKTDKANGIKRPRSSTAQPKRKNVQVKTENIHPDLYGQSAGQGYRAPMPMMQTMAMQQTMQQTPTNHPYMGKFDTPAPASDFGDDPQYDTPTMRNNLPSFSLYQAEEKSEVSAEDGISNNLNGTDDGEDEEDPHQVSRASQLKGKLWPGMSLFDSATPEMRKQRNQKKDRSVLEGLKQTSLITEATEVVYTSDGTLKRSRPLYNHGDSDNESMESVVVETPVKRRATRKTNAMRKIDGNAPRRRRKSSGNGSKTASKKPGLRSRSGMTNFEDGSKPGNSDSFPFRTMSRSISSRTTSTTGESKYEPSIDDEEIPPSYRAMRPAKKSKISVFRDDDRASLEDEEEVSPGRTESTLEEHRFEDFQPDPYQPVLTRQTMASPTPSYRQSIGNGRYPFDGAIGRAREMSEKENMMPDHRYAAERESNRYTAQYGHPSSMQFAPASYSGQYYQESTIMNPLRSQSQQSVHLQSQDYSQNPYTYSESNGYGGDFKPMIPPQYVQGPLPPYMSGGPGSGVLANPAHGGHNLYFS